MCKYIIYVHIAPNNKKYFGITKTSILERSGKDGRGYRNNKYFWRAIQKYGWENFQHIVLAENLSKEWACKLEQDLIWRYQSNNPKYGYNLSAGGECPAYGCHHSLAPETIAKIQKSRSWYKHHSEETKKKISESNLGKIISPEIRTQISESVKLLWQTDEYREKQNNRVVSDVSRKRMSDAHKGYVMPDEQKEKIRLGNLGKHQSEETKRKISEIVKEQHKKEKSLGIKRKYNSGSVVVGTKWYNNGVKNIRSASGCPDGFVPGRLHYEYPKNRKSRKKLAEDDAEPVERTEKKVRDIRKNVVKDKEDMF